MSRRLERTTAQLEQATRQIDVLCDGMAEARKAIAHRIGMVVYAASLLRLAADQFDVRGAADTARHYRAEADKLDPRPSPMMGEQAANLQVDHAAPAGARGRR